MSAPDFAAIEASMAETNMDMLANCFVTASGAPFAARLSAADDVAFDVAQAGDYVLRYLIADATLADRDEITIDSAAYIVTGHPRRINAYEALAQLVEAD